MPYDTLEKLLDRTIVKIEIGDTDRYLRFTDSNGETTSFSVDGDCCSSSYFNDILGVKNLLGQKVLQHLSRDLPHEDYNGDLECISYYGASVGTINGYFDVIFRNESNGYYGGWMYECDPPDNVVWADVLEDLENIS